MTAGQGKPPLTAEQVEAVEAPAGPQLLVAGAGSGKTTVMAERIVHLVASGQAAPDQVLGLTFTNKAAAHLALTVRQALDRHWAAPRSQPPPGDVTVGTYHSFGAALVADHALELDLPPRPRLLNRAQAWQLLYAVFDEFRFERRRTLYPQALLDDALNLASRCADHLVPIEVVADDCRRILAGEGPGLAASKAMRDAAAKRLELCQVVAAYHRRKRDRGMLDFGDQIALAVRLVEEHPGVAAGLAAEHPVVLLDEYQDTNYAQRRLLQVVYGPGASITAVGDDMQSIYGFRGAHLANILHFEDHFPPVTTRRLQTSFRFGPGLVELANRIQGQVAAAHAKTLAAPAGAAPTTIECFLAADEAEEAATIAADIASNGRRDDVAVLCRKRRLIAPIVAALEDAGIAVEVVGASGLLDRPEIVDLVAWLEVLADGGAGVALLRILTGPRYRIGLADLAALGRRARAEGVPLATVAAAPAGVDGLTAEAGERLAAFAAELAELSTAADGAPVIELAETVADRTGLWGHAGALGRENLLRFLDLAGEFAPVDGETGLAAFVEYLQLLDETDDDIAEAHLTDAEAVKVMTIHQAKGLEFATVYVPGLAGSGRSKIFPDGRAGENAMTNSSALPWWLRDDDGIPSPAEATPTAIEAVIRGRRLEEEWRLLYVACTRARRRLVCSAAHWYSGPAEPQGPSPFYDFVAAQTDIVTERFRHCAAEVDPEVAAKERQRARSRAGVAVGAAPAASPPTPGAPAATVGGAGPRPGQLRLDVAGGERPAPVAVGAPRVVSVTALVTYARCPRQFFWTAVRPLPRRGSAAARLGTEVHRWIEARGDRQLNLLEPEGPTAERHPPPPGRRPTAPEESPAAALRACFLASPYAELTPVRVEAPFVLVVGGRVVRGRVDAAYERDGRLELVDFKTGHVAPDDDGGAGTQLDLYGLAAAEAWGADPDRLRTTYCYLRTDGPALVIATDWTAARVGEVRQRLAAAFEAMAAGAYAPTPGPWCPGCDFLAVCAEGRRHTEGRSPPS